MGGLSTPPARFWGSVSKAKSLPCNAKYWGGGVEKSEKLQFYKALLLRYESLLLQITGSCSALTMDEWELLNLAAGHSLSAGELQILSGGAEHRNSCSEKCLVLLLQKLVCLM